MASEVGRGQSRKKPGARKYSTSTRAPDWSKLTEARVANEPDRLTGIAEEIAYLNQLNVSEEELKDAAFYCEPPPICAPASLYKGVYQADPRRAQGPDVKGQGIKNRAAAWSEGREWMAVVNRTSLGFFFTERAAAVAVFMSTNGEGNVDRHTYFDQPAAGAHHHAALKSHLLLTCLPVSPPAPVQMRRPRPHLEASNSSRASRCQGTPAFKKRRIRDIAALSGPAAWRGAST